MSVLAKRKTILTNHSQMMYIPQDSAVQIPAWALTWNGFREWAQSDDYPEHGKICFINQKVFIDMSPDELETHNKVRGAVDGTLIPLNQKIDEGEYFEDGALVTNKAAGLATVPDATFVKWETSQSGLVKFIPRKGRLGQFVEIQGTPDWVLEVVSFSSLIKDTIDLPIFYHRAKIPEYWLVDARGPEISFKIRVYQPRKYKEVVARKSWFFSPVFQRNFRLTRKPNPMGRWNYKLEMKPA